MIERTGTERCRYKQQEDRETAGEGDKVIEIWDTEMQRQGDRQTEL